MTHSTQNPEPTYTFEQLIGMVCYTRKSDSQKAGKPVYSNRDHLAQAFTRACNQAQAINGHDELRQEYTRCRKSNAFPKDFLDRIFPYWPKVNSSKGFPLKFIDYSRAVHAAPNLAVPPINTDYTARIVEAARQIDEERELEKELAAIYATIDAIDLNSDPFPVDLGEAALWLGYKGDPRQAKNNAKIALMSMDVAEGVDYVLRLNIQTQTPGRGGHNAETIRLTAECFKNLCLRSGTKRAEMVRKYFMLAEKRFRATFKGEANAIHASNNPADLENMIPRVSWEEAGDRIMSTMEELGETLGGVETKFLAQLESMQYQIESMRAEILTTVKKCQTPAEADLKRLHGNLYQQVLEQSYRYPDGIHCPCCNKPTTAWEVDHWNSKTNPARTNGWKVCRPCNQALGAAGDTSKRHQYRARFDAFQIRCDDYEQYLKGDEVQMDLL